MSQAASVPAEGDQIAALTARVRELEDERDIRLTLERYGHSIDYGLEDQWVDCFTEHGVDDHRMANMPSEWKSIFPFAEFDSGGMRLVGRDALAAFIAMHTRPPKSLHKHLVVDTVITRGLDPDKAESASYFLRVDEAGPDRIISAFGRYIDQLERCEDGRWRFSERRIELESLLPTASEGPNFASSPRNDPQERA
ncbi:MAG TPA: nuclear transport factor 2 family protein [Chloroflexota bacterium]|jgi:hypothetical protein|nr:nuclear transport factor 2 family protein [Chloroflexota bacterium]